MAREIKAPGLEWRRRKYGEVPYWIAPKEAVKAGFSPKAANLSWIAGEPDRLIARCEALMAEAIAFVSLGATAIDPWDGTLAGMLKLYETDSESPFHELSYGSKRQYVAFMRRMIRVHGDRRIDDITGRDISIWYKVWTKGVGGKSAPSSGRMAMCVLKASSRFAVGCRKEGAFAFREVVKTFSYPSMPPRTQVISREEVIALRRAAHIRKGPSRALAAALQFDALIRLYDVIGQWVPLSDPRPSAVLGYGQKWLGPQWEDLTDDHVLDFVPTKTRNTTGAKVVVPLLSCPMVMEELQLVPPEKRVGPLIVNEATGLPYRAAVYRNVWRKDADLANLPKDKLARDLRASANTEAREADASTDDLAKVAAHSKAVNSRVYDRAGVAAFERVAKARAKKVGTA